MTLSKQHIGLEMQTENFHYQRWNQGRVKPGIQVHGTEKI